MSPNQSSVDLNRWGDFQKTLLLKLATDSYKNRPRSVIIEYNFSQTWLFPFNIPLRYQICITSVAKTILHMFPFHVLLWLPFHVVTTNERFRRLPTLFQALRLSGEDAKVKGMRKVGSFLPFFHVRSFLIPSELPRSMEQTRDCQNIVTVVQPSCQYDVTLSRFRDFSKWRAN